MKNDIDLVDFLLYFATFNTYEEMQPILEALKSPKFKTIYEGYKKQGAVEEFISILKETKQLPMRKQKIQ